MAGKEQMMSIFTGINQLYSGQCMYTTSSSMLCIMVLLSVLVEGVEEQWKPRLTFPVATEPLTAVGLVTSS